MFLTIETADNGTMHFWDWKTGYNFQRLQAAVQPGSIDSEAGIFALAFDHSGSRLITAEADKTIKIYKEDESAVCCPLINLRCFVIVATKEILVYNIVFSIPYFIVKFKRATCFYFLLFDSMQ